MVEQLICNQQVVGSSPIASSIWMDARVVKGEQTVNLPAHAYIGSNPIPSTIFRGVEQLVARRAHNPKVVGSSPTPATMFFRKTILLNIALLI